MDSGAIQTKTSNPVQCGEYYLNELLYAIAKKYDLDELLSVPGQAEELSVGIDSTLSDMRKEAAKRPELKGINIQGKTKTAFFANLAEAWSRCKFLEAVAGLGANETKEKHSRIFQGIVYQIIDRMKKRMTFDKRCFDKKQRFYV